MAKVTRKQRDQKVIELANKGVPGSDIARTVNVHPSTVTRILQKYATDIKDVKEFRTHRADIFASLQHQALSLASRVMLSVNDEEISTMATAQKTGLLGALTNLGGTTYDKERLETGQSTSNAASLLLVARSDAAKVPLDE